MPSVLDLQLLLHEVKGAVSKSCIAGAGTVKLFQVIDSIDNILCARHAPFHHVVDYHRDGHVLGVMAFRLLSSPISPSYYRHPSSVVIKLCIMPKSRN